MLFLAHNRIPFPTTSFDSSLKCCRNRKYIHIIFYGKINHANVIFNMLSLFLAIRQDHVLVGRWARAKSMVPQNWSVCAFFFLYSIKKGPSVWRSLRIFIWQAATENEWSRKRSNGHKFYAHSFRLQPNIYVFTSHSMIFEQEMLVCVCVSVIYISFRYLYLLGHNHSWWFLFRRNGWSGCWWVEMLTLLFATTTNSAIHYMVSFEVAGAIMMKIVIACCHPANDFI